MKLCISRSCRCLSALALLFAFIPTLHAQQTQAPRNAGLRRRPTPGTPHSPGRWAPISCLPTPSMSWRCGRLTPLTPTTIDRELGWAQAIGMNTMRVFLHNLLWEQDPKGFQQRIDTFPHHRRASSHPAGLCALRFLLGGQSQAGPAASAHPRRPQLRLGAGAGSGRSAGSRAIPAPGELCEGRSGRLCQRSPDSGLGRVE